MANLLEISELILRQMYPEPSDETATELEEIVATAKMEYAYQMWVLSKNERNQEGVFNVPSILATEDELIVKDKEADISHLPALRSLSNDTWIMNLGGFACECKYIRSTVNHAQVLCDDDCLGNFKTYFVVGDKIKFPQGTHQNKLPITFANNGYKVDETIKIDEVVASGVRSRLQEIYLNKVAPEDVTNNSNPNQ